MSICNEVREYYNDRNVYGDGDSLAAPCDTLSTLEQLRTYCNIPSFIGASGTALSNACRNLAVLTDGVNIYNNVISGDFDAGLVRIRQPPLISTASTPYISIGSEGEQSFDIQLVGDKYVCMRYSVYLTSSSNDFCWVRAYDANTGTLVNTLADVTATFRVYPMSLWRYSDRYVIYQADFDDNYYPDVMIYDAVTNTTSVCTDPLMTGNYRRNQSIPGISADGTVTVRSQSIQTIDPPSFGYQLSYSVNGGSIVTLTAADWTSLGAFVDISFDGRYIMTSRFDSTSGFTVYDTALGIPVGIFPLTVELTLTKFVQGSYNVIGYHFNNNGGGNYTSEIYVLNGANSTSNNFAVVPGLGNDAQIFSIESFSTGQYVVTYRSISANNNIVTTVVTNDGGTTFETILVRNTFNSLSYATSVSPSWFTASKPHMVVGRIVISDPPGVDNRDVFTYHDARDGNRLDEDMKEYMGVVGGDPMLLLDNGVVIAGPVVSPVWTSRTTDTVTLNSQSYDAAIEYQTNILLPDTGITQYWTSPNGTYILKYDGTEFMLFQNVANTTQYVVFIDNTASPSSTYLDEAESTYASVYSQIVSALADRRSSCSSPENSVSYVFGPDLVTTNPSLYDNVLPTSLCINKNSVNLRASAENSLVANYVRRQVCPGTIVICTSIVNIDESKLGGNFETSQNCGNSGCTSTTDCGIGQTCLSGTCRDTCTTSTATCNCDPTTNTCITSGGGGGGDTDDETNIGMIIGITIGVLVGIGLIVLIGFAAVEKLPGQKNYKKSASTKKSQ